MNANNNYVGKLTNLLTLEPLRRIRKIFFSFDIVLLSVSMEGKTPPDVFLKVLKNRYRCTKTIAERLTQSKAWAGLFKTRTYFELGPDSYMMVLTEKTKALAHLHFLIFLNNPSSQHLREIHQLLLTTSCIRSYVISGAEFTFDMVLKKEKYREQLRRLLRLSCYFAYGRTGFEYGVPPCVTYYLNSRKSVKQLRAYLKDEVRHGKKKLDVFRIEIKINRAKAKRIGLQTIPDLLSYDMKLLKEVKLYFFSPYDTWRSLTNYNTLGFFSECIAKKILRKGFQQATIMAKKEIKCCPNNCFEFEDKCPVYDLDASISGKKRLRMIQRCRYSVPCTNIKRDLAYEVETFNVYCNKMIRAFEDWL